MKIGALQRFAKKAMVAIFYMVLAVTISSMGATAKDALTDRSDTNATSVSDDRHFDSHDADESFTHSTLHVDNHSHDQPKNVVTGSDDRLTLTIEPFDNSPFRIASTDVPPDGRPPMAAVNRFQG